MDGSGLVLPPGWVHVYVSTACLHGEHELCGWAQRGRGDGAAPHCKFCPAVCRCPTCAHGGPRPVVRAVRGFYREYRPGHGGRVTRVHVFSDVVRWAGAHGLCGAFGGARRRSEPAVLDPLPAALPPGLSWCGSCVGRLAERVGVLPVMGAMVVAGRVPG